MKINKRQNKFMFAYFLLLFVTMIYGKEMQSFNGMDLSAGHFALVLFAAVLGSALVVFLHVLFKDKWSSLHFHVDLMKIGDCKNSQYLIMGILLIGWLPAFLSFYPGNWTYDTNWAVNMISYNNISAHQPLLFTFILNLALHFGDFIGSDQLAVVLFTLLQMVFLSYSFTKAMKYVFKQYSVSAYVQWLIVLFFALMPFNQVFAVTIAKDVTFAGFAPLVIVNFAELMESKEKPVSKWKLFGLITTCTVWIALRNNAFYALLVFGIICLFVYGRKSKVTIVALVTCVCYFVVNKSVISFCGYGTSSPMEMLSVPMSQLARVSVIHESELTESEQTMMDRIFPTEYNRDYHPYIADFVKITIPGYNMHDRQNLIGFISFYKNMALRFPEEYVNAFSMLNVGSYYPLDETYARVYIDTYKDGVKYTKPESDISIGYISTLFEENAAYDYHQESLFKSGKDFYNRLCTKNSFMGNPLLMVLFSPATYFWMIFASFLVAWCNKNTNLIMLSLLPLLYWCTQLLGPCALSRYLYVLMVLAPLYMIMAFCTKRMA